MRLDYGAILFALATTAVAAPMPDSKGGKDMQQEERGLRWGGLSNLKDKTYYTTDGKKITGDQINWVSSLTIAPRALTSFATFSGSRVAVAKLTSGPQRDSWRSH